MNLLSSMKSKILILVCLPLAVALLLASLHVYREWEVYQKALKDNSHGEVILVASHMIHELQKERGKSALFLSGNVNSDGLNQQRENVGAKLKALTEKSQDPLLRSEIVSMVRAISSGLEKVRSQVDAKNEASEVSKAYGKLVDDLIQLEVLAARTGTFEADLSGPIMLDVAKENVGKMRAFITNILGSNKPLSMTQFASLQYLMASLNANLHSPILKVSKEGIAKIDKFNSSEEWNKVQQVFRQVSDKATEGNYGEDPKSFYESVTKSIDGLADIVQGDLVQVEDRIHDSKAQSERMMAIVGAAAIFLTVGIALFAILVIRAITKPIQQAVSELGQSADQVTNAFEQLRSASYQISSGTSQSAASLEETVASVEEISSMIKTNAQGAQQATQLSKDGCDLARQGETEIQKLLNNMSELSGSSQKIEQIIGVIDDIAFQINLLSLNAAVEAARAGEQGKGFGVVADAVRQLAQKSAVAAQDIGSLIKESVQKTREGYKAAESSGAALGTIVKSVKSTSTLIEEISNSSQEQAKGLSQITKAMNELDSATQSNAASAEQASSSAESLSDQAQVMKNLVQRLNRIVEGRAVRDHDSDHAQHKKSA